MNTLALRLLRTSLCLTCATLATLASAQTAPRTMVAIAPQAKPMTVHTMPAPAVSTTTPPQAPRTAKRPAARTQVALDDSDSARFRYASCGCSGD
jgi:hypothetical protein